MNDRIAIAKGREQIDLLLAMANRHGLIAGATGTGKTVSLKVLAEGFSQAGVPVFLADVKGDLAGLAQIGTPEPKILERAAVLDMGQPSFRPYPVRFWDVFGDRGHPIRATISEMGPILLARLLDLNDTQTGVLTLVFRIADDNGHLLLDLKDLQAMVQHVGENSREYTTQFGNVSTATIGAIQRSLLMLDEQDGEKFFGEPALSIGDLMQVDENGLGRINVLAAEKLVNNPKVYSTFLLWLLSELFEELPEAGDIPKPKLVFFFDEAHLLFDEAPKALLEKIEQVVRLIRSKGIGIYFVSQSPLDIPDQVLGQLGNRVQHALRAFTARDQKAVRAAAETFRADGTLSVEEAITELGIGEALVSVLDTKGIPTVVQRALVFPPKSKIGPITEDERRAIVQSSPVFGKYEKSQDRISAYERLKGKASRAEQEDEAETESAPSRPREGKIPAPPDTPGAKQLQAFFTSAARSIGSTLGRQIVRGVLGSIMGTPRRRH